MLKANAAPTNHLAGRFSNRPTRSATAEAALKEGVGKLRPGVNIRDVRCFFFLLSID